MTQRPGRWWSPEEDFALTRAVGPEKRRDVTWAEIAKAVPGRTPIQCQHHWSRSLRPGIKKGPWTEEEDERLKEAVGVYGTHRWVWVGKMVGERYGMSKGCQSLSRRRQSMP